MIHHIIMITVITTTMVIVTNFYAKISNQES